MKEKNVKERRDVRDRDGEMRKRDGGKRKVGIKEGTIKETGKMKKKRETNER